MKPLVRSIKIGVLNYGSDVFFLFMAVLCFGVFINNSINSDRFISNSSFHVARVKSGNIERKRSGMYKFYKTELNQELFNRDVIWVPKQSSGEIEFSKNEVLKIKEETLLVIYRPGINTNGKGVVEVLKGRVENAREFNLNSQYKIQADSSNTAQDQADDIKKSIIKTLPQVSSTALPSDTYPKQNSIFFIGSKSGQAAISLGWPSISSGKVIIESSADRKVFEVSFNRTNFIEHVFKQGARYTWKVVDADNKLLFGPFLFKVEKFDSAIMSDILKNKTKQHIEIIY